MEDLDSIVAIQEVYIQVSLTKINDIDTVNQRFQAEALIESKWYDPNIRQAREFDSTKIWKPELYIENAINDVKEEVWYKTLNDKKSGKIMVYEFRKIKGLFWENLELQNFPLDIQDLSLIVATKKSGDKIRFKLLQPEKQIISINNTLDSSMWLLNKMVNIGHDKIYREFSYARREYPVVWVKVQAFRLPGFFYWNAVLPIFLITLASLGPFVIDFKLPQSRLPSTATLLLTSVSFRSVVGRLLPTVSYLTSLDKYSLASIFIITLQFLYHSLIGASFTYLGDKSSILIDRIVFGCFFLVIISKQMIFYNWIKRVSKVRQNLYVYDSGIRKKID